MSDPTPSRRPGPLREWHPTQFLTTDGKAPSNPFKPHPKRTLSPGVALFSPTKRRLLNEDRSTFKGEMTHGTPSSRSTSSSSDSFNPARKLDFTPSKGKAATIPTSECRTPKAQTSLTRKLAPSPEMQVPSWNGTDASVGPNPFLTDSPRSDSTTLSHTTPFMVPRELPPNSDPQSIHYPGFEIHRDRFIELPSASSPPPCPPQADDPFKENVPPRKKSKKALSAPLETCGEKTGFSADHARQCKSTPLRPPPRTTNAAILAARSPAQVRLQSFTPGRTPRAGKLDGKHMMEREADYDDCDDDDVVMALEL